MRLMALWWWIDRWRKSTAYMDMTLAEQGAYRNLLDEAHLRGGPLPLDDRILAKACGDALAWPAVREKVLARFERCPDGWRNRTLDEVIKESERRADKQRAYRERGNRNGNGGGNGDGNNNHNRVGSPSPSPSPSLISGSDSGTKIQTVSSASDKPTPEPAAVLVFPATGQGAQTWALTQAQLDEWTEAYPDIDVMAQARKALVWIQANRRKTAKGMPRFMVSWLNRATNTDASTRAPMRTEQPRTQETRPHAAGTLPGRQAFDADWWEECQVIHAGACEGDRMRHHLRIQTDAAKAG